MCYKVSCKQVLDLFEIEQIKLSIAAEVSAVSESCSEGSVR